MKKFSQIFKEKYYDLMLKPSHPSNPIRNRADSFYLIFNELEKIKNDNFIIVETGCMRSDHGDLCFGDDGASTFIFDDFIIFYDGEVLSVDINQSNVNHAKSMVSTKTIVECMDSVEFLWNLPSSKKIDFLYLDSYDFDPDNPIPSQLHHVKELCAVMKNLKKGTIIVVDDHLNTSEFDSYRSTLAKGGKAGFIENFMTNVKAEVLHDGYQIVWRL
jgi:hypothetical protein